MGPGDTLASPFLPGMFTSKATVGPDSDGRPPGPPAPPPPSAAAAGGGRGLPGSAFVFPDSNYVCGSAAGTGNAAALHPEMTGGAREGEIGAEAPGRGGVHPAAGARKRIPGPRPTHLAALSCGKRGEPCPRGAGQLLGAPGPRRAGQNAACRLGRSLLSWEYGGRGGWMQVGWGKRPRWQSPRDLLSAPPHRFSPRPGFAAAAFAPDRLDPFQG